MDKLKSLYTYDQDKQTFCLSFETTHFVYNKLIASLPFHEHVACDELNWPDLHNFLHTLYIAHLIPTLLLVLATDHVQNAHVFEEPHYY